MIILEFIVEVIFEGIIVKSFRSLKKAFNKIIPGSKNTTNPLNEIESKFLYKRIKLSKDLNETLKTGQKGAVLEVIDERRAFAEFYDSQGNQIEINHESVFEVKLNQLKVIQTSEPTQLPTDGKN